MIFGIIDVKLIVHLLLLSLERFQVYQKQIIIITFWLSLSIRFLMRDTVMLYPYLFLLSILRGCLKSYGWCIKYFLPHP